MNDDHKKLHPVLWIAAIAVTAASLVAIARMSGWFNPSTEPTLASAAESESAARAEERAQRDNKRPSAKREVARTEPPTLPRYSRGDSYPSVSSYPASRRYCADCGVVEGVRTVQVPAKASGAGAVAGGVLGGVLGHQVGEGSGKDVATVAGAVIGGFTGHQVEKRVRTTTRYEVDVTMADGTRRAVPYSARPNWSRGDEVVLRDGVLSRAPRSSSGVESL